MTRMLRQDINALRAMSWIREPTTPGRAVVKERLETIPKGPYTYVWQGQQSKFQEDPTSPDFPVSDEFKWILGSFVYIVDPETKDLVLVAQYLDTSD